MQNLDKKWTASAILTGVYEAIEEIIKYNGEV